VIDAHGLERPGFQRVSGLIDLDDHGPDVPPAGGAYRPAEPGHSLAGDAIAAWINRRVKAVDSPMTLSAVPSTRAIYASKRGSVIENPPARA
jgi:hypothetical protein